MVTVTIGCTAEAADAWAVEGGGVLAESAGGPDVNKVVGVELAETAVGEVGLKLVPTAAAGEDGEGEAGAAEVSLLALCSAARARSFSILAGVFFLFCGT